MLGPTHPKPPSPLRSAVDPLDEMRVPALVSKQAKAAARRLFDFFDRKGRGAELEALGLEQSQRRTFRAATTFAESLFAEGDAGDEDFGPILLLADWLRGVFASGDVEARLAKIPDNVAEALRTLHPLVEESASAILAALTSRDVEALQDILSEPVKTHREFNPLHGYSGRTGSLRFEPGHRVAVPRPEGGFEEGVVLSVGLNNNLTVEMPLPGGKLRVQTVAIVETLQACAVRIGEKIRGVPGLGDVWCDGINADGRHFGWCQPPGGELRRLEGDDFAQVAVAYAPLFERQTNPKQPFPQDLIARAVAGIAPAVVHAPAAGEPFELAVLGGQELEGVHLFRFEGMEVAVVANAGGKRQEDGVVVGRRYTEEGRERVAVFVIDEAGGGEKMAGKLASACSAVGQAQVEGLKKLATAPDAGVELASLWVDADGAVKTSNRDATAGGAYAAAWGFVHTAGEDSLQHGGVGDCELLVFESGGGLDSRSARDNDGDQMTAATQDPNAGLSTANGITRALGLFEKGERVKSHKLTFGVGDYVVEVSDGAGDLNEKAQVTATRSGKPWPFLSTRNNRLPCSDLFGTQLEELFAANPDPASAAWAIGECVRLFVEWGRAKVDNVTIVVARRTAQP